MNNDFVVDVFHEGAFCSGYLIAPSLVLTSRHGIVAERTDPCDLVGIRPVVGRLADIVRYECAIAWQTAHVDALLLEVVDGRWLPRRRSVPVRWGGLPDVADLDERHATVSCAASGFPLAQRQRNAVRAMEAMAGTIHLGTGSLTGMFQVQVTSGDLADVDGRSGWHGMSGAAVFAGDLLVGLLVEDTPNIQARLTALPVSELLEHPEAVAVMDRHGLLCKLESVPVGGPIPVRPQRVRVGLVPRRAGYFQQRPEQTALGRTLAGGRTAVLTQVVAGMGGVGKTQLAADYAARTWEQMHIEVLVWVATANDSTLIASYAEAATELGLSLGADAESSAVAFLNWLAVTELSWLVVMDDVKSASNISRWLPQGSNDRGRIIITTRLRDAAIRSIGQTIQVDLFTPTQSLAYLTASLGPGARYPLVVLEEAAALAQDLGQLPIALAQAAAYIANKQITCAEYRQRMRDQKRRLPLPEPELLPDGHQHSANLALHLSVEAADALEPHGLASLVMRLAAALDPNGIPMELFICTSSLRYLTNVEGASGRHAESTTAEHVRDALANLHTMRAVDVVDARVHVHAMVQRSITDRMSRAGLADAVVAAADGLLLIWPTEERDQSHAQTLRSNAASLRVRHTDALWAFGAHPLLFREGTSLGEWGLVSNALSFFEDLYMEANRRRGSGHPDVLRIRGSIAYWKAKFGDAAGALRISHELLADQVRLLGEDHLQTLSTRQTIAWQIGAAGDPVVAVAEFRKLLADRMRYQGPDHVDTINTRRQLGHWQGEMGDVAGAVATLEGVLSDALRVLGPVHQRTLSIRHYLALWRGARGSDVSILTRLRDRLVGLELPAEFLPDGDGSRERSFDWSLGNPAASEALEVLQGVHEQYLAVLGPDHPETLSIRDSIARWTGYSGDVDRAFAEFSELLKDRLRILGPYHRDTLTTRHNVAFWLGASGGHRAALDRFEELLVDTIAVFGNSHPDTIANLHNIAFWKGCAEGPEVAVTELKTLLRDTSQVLGADHRDTLAIHHNLANWLGDAGDFTGAIAELQNVLAQRVRVLSPQHKDVEGTKRDLSHWQLKSSESVGQKNRR